MGRAMRRWVMLHINESIWIIFAPLFISIFNASRDKLVMWHIDRKNRSYDQCVPGPLPGESLFCVVQSQEAAATDFNETPGTKFNYNVEPGMSLESVLPASWDRITQKETPSEGGGFLR